MILFQLHANAGTDGFSAFLSQPSLDGSARPIVYISRVTLPDEAI